MAISLLFVQNNITLTTDFLLEKESLKMVGSGQMQAENEKNLQIRREANRTQSTFYGLPSQE